MKRFTKPQRLQVGTSDVVWEAAIFHLPWINSPTRARVHLLWYFMCCDPSSSVDLLTSQHLNEADAEKERSQKRRMSSYVSVCKSLFIYYTDVVLITCLLLPVITSVVCIQYRSCISAFPNVTPKDRLNLDVSPHLSCHRSVRDV